MARLPGKGAFMKVMTILGTRPEIIRLSRIIEKLDGLCKQVVVHTGQNYDVKLDGIFFEQLGVRAPDHYLAAKGGFGEQIGKILAESERVMMAEKPDRFLVLGDTNSSLAAIMAKRLQMIARAYDPCISCSVHFLKFTRAKK